MAYVVVFERFALFDRCVRSGRYPNAAALADRFEISRKTAQRNIDFMRDRLAAPLEYDPSRRGWIQTLTFFYWTTRFGPRSPSGSMD
jgi:predicted DNA-binding transcriptional regulator YafY